MTDRRVSHKGRVGALSDDKKHEASLLLLREVAEYLGRLPPVPLTRELCSKVLEHLNEPTHRLIEHEARSRRRGEAFNGAGLPLIAAEVQGEVVTISMRTEPKGLNVDRDVLVALKRKGGIRLRLSERLPSLDEG